MQKIKYLLISLLLLFTTLILVAFLVQGVDYLVHYDTYSKIDKVFGDMRAAGTNNKCYANYRAMFPSKMPINTTEKKQLISIVVPTELYDKAVLSCNNYKEDLLKISVPQGLPTEQQRLLKKCLKSRIVAVESLLVAMDQLNTCKKDLDCFGKAQKAERAKKAQSFEQFRNTTEELLATIKLEKRLSLEYYFILRPMEQNYKNKLNSAALKNLNFGQNPLIQ